MSRNAYLALATGLGGAGLLAACYAAPLAASCLRLGPVLQAQTAAVLLGCWGASLLRGASLAVFLAEGAVLGELGSWRYQRANVVLVLAAAATAAAALTCGWHGAAPWALLPLAAGAAAVAAGCGALAARQALQPGPRGGLYFASALGYLADPLDAPGVAWLFCCYTLTSLAGATMAGLALLGLGAGAAALLGGGPAAAAPWLAAAPPAATGAGALALLHRLLGAGLLLLGGQALVLMEHAARARDLQPEAAVKLMAAMGSEDAALADGSLGPAPVHAPPGRFQLLQAGFLAAAAVQAAWLLAAGGGGGGAGLLNAADVAFGSLYWTLLGSAAYGLMLAAEVDYADVKVWLLRLADAAGGLVSAGAAVLYVDWQWLTPVQRR